MDGAGQSLKHILDKVKLWHFHINEVVVLGKELVLERSHPWKPFNCRITELKPGGRFKCKLKIDLDPLFLPNALLQPQES